MPQILKQPKTQIKVVPRDGQIEITLNINITVDGKVSATTDAESVEVQQTKEEEDTGRMVPDFFSVGKLKFGKDKD